MRKIKFMAFDGESVKRVQAIHFASNGHDSMIMVYLIGGRPSGYVEGESCNLMEYSGIKDISEMTEIYEGDILQTQNIEHHLWVVSVCDGRFLMSRIEKKSNGKSIFEDDLCADNIAFYNLIKVGNIYENPEMLNFKKGELCDALCYATKSIPKGV